MIGVYLDSRSHWVLLWVCPLCLDQQHKWQKSEDYRIIIFTDDNNFLNSTEPGYSVVYYGYGVWSSLIGQAQERKRCKPFEYTVDNADHEVKLLKTLSKLTKPISKPSENYANTPKQPRRSL